jgi:hypothetical protein
MRRTISIITKSLFVIAIVGGLSAGNIQAEATFKALEDHASLRLGRSPMFGTHHKHFLSTVV